MAVPKKEPGPDPEKALSVLEYPDTIANATPLERQLQAVLSGNGAALPSFANVSVSDSTNVHFGNRTYINGPLTVKQVVDKQKDKNINKEPAPNFVKEPIKGLKYVWNQLISNSQRRHLLIIMSVIILLFVFTTIVLVSIPRGTFITYGRSTEDLAKNIPIKTDIDAVLLTSQTLRMVTRQEWLAQPTNEPGDPLHQPTPLVIVMHTATESCTDQASCTFYVRFMQTFHIESRGWNDIGYNFLIGGDGSVYEGRGWDTIGAHTKGYNVCSVGIAFIGLFNDKLPSERQLTTFAKLVDLGVKLGHIDPKYRLMGARQLSPTLSPGDALFNEIKKMDHFSNALNETQEQCTKLQELLYKIPNV